MVTPGGHYARRHIRALHGLDERTPKIEAFNYVEIFRSYLDHYKSNGGVLPEAQFVSNVLLTKFNLPQGQHEKFTELYNANHKFIGGATATAMAKAPASAAAASTEGSTVIVGQPSGNSKLRAFVVMPFSEKTPRYPKGFFAEVLKVLITPAATAAGFVAVTARRDGSDLIHSTIIKELINCDMIIADLTEHNPNVLFELGMALAQKKPVALIRASGTAQIFDVDNIMRVWDYDSNLWPSTVAGNLENLTAHIRGTWDNRKTDKSYMDTLT